MKKNSRNISSLVGLVLEKTPKKHFALRKLSELWRTALGESIAAHSSPEDISYGTLIVHVDDPIWISELSLQKDEILKKLKEMLSLSGMESLFSKIRFQNGEVHLYRESIENETVTVVRPEVLEKIDGAISTIEDEDLKNSLAHYLLVCERKKQIREGGENG